MTEEPQVQPLPYQRRRYTFLGLVTLFVLVLPVLFFYASGYRIELSDFTNIISTGGIYVSAERTGAEIYIDDELVRETRTFRTAFYAQSLEPGTHRVHVQKADHHTWVKELPVYPHLVTESQAFNLPIDVPFRVLAEYETIQGDMVVATTTGRLASSTNALYATSSKATTTYRINTEFLNLRDQLLATSATATVSLGERVLDALTIPTATTSTPTTTELLATTTKELRGATLFEREGDIFATWTGSREEMPYYYCAESFPPYQPASSTASTSDPLLKVTKGANQGANVAELAHPIQEIPEDVACEPVIQLDRQGQKVRDFLFFPGGTDFVVLSLEDGVYVVEIDNRAWQNVQPLFMGTNLRVLVENGAIYVYDGTLFYEMMLE